MKSNKTFSFLKIKYGDPDYLLEYKTPKENREIDILVYLPVPEEEIFESTLISSGFSLSTINSNKNKFEYIFDLKDTLTENEYKKLGKEIIVQLENFIPFSNKIFSPIQLSNYPHITGFLILNYGKHEPYYWETNPTLQAFELIALHKEEIDSILQQPKDIFNVIIFRSDKINWTDWNRPKADIIHEALSGVWSYITKWYKEHAPKIFTNLKTGANQKSITKLIDAIGIKMPKDFIASLMIYDGEIDFHDYKYLSTTQIIETWEMMNKLLKDNAFPSQLHDNKKIEQIQDSWWHEKWIPFAKDGGGNLMCIDLAPTPSGTNGQIIYWEKTEGPIPTQYKSFLHWLYAYEQALYTGYYKVDEEGFIYY